MRWSTMQWFISDGPQSKDSLVSDPIVRARVKVWVIVSVWIRFRVGIWDTFRLLFRVRAEVIRFRIRVRLRVRVDVEFNVCFGGLQ